MKTSTYLFLLFLLNILIGASIVQDGANILLIKRALPFLPAWVFLWIGWGFVISGLLCLLTRLLWSSFVQRFLGASVLRLARISSLSLSLCVLCPWAMIAVLETLVLHSAVLGAAIYLMMVWAEGKELKWPDLTPEIEQRAQALFKQIGKP